MQQGKQTARAIEMTPGSKSQTLRSTHFNTPEKAVAVFITRAAVDLKGGLQAEAFAGPAADLVRQVWQPGRRFL
jgi:hypothetical protein